MASRSTLWALCLAVVMGVPARGWSDELSDESIEDRAGEVLATLPFFAGEGRGRYRMVVEGQNGERFERELVVETRKVRGSLRTRIDVASPADLAGRVFLFVAHRNKPDEYWIHVPAFEATRPIDGSQRHGSLLRSHLTYRDALGFRWDGASFGDVRAEEVEGASAAVIRIAPGREDDTEYERADVSMRRSDGAPIRCTFRAADDSGEKIFEVKSWSGSGSTARIEVMTVGPSSGGFTRLELREFKPKPTRPKKDFLPGEFADSDGPTDP